MDFKTYSDTALVTAAGGSMHFEVCNPGVMNAVLDALLELKPDVDAVKKGMFYGKKKDELADWTIYRRPLKPEDRECKAIEADYDIWHGVIGIITEALELLELVRTGEFTRENIADEAGDKLWYFALLLRGAKLGFDEVALGNIKKLAARFPAGHFNVEDWENRDKENEAKEIAAVL